MSQFHDFCGDSTASETDVEEESFRSPSLPPDATDYGFVFTGSHRKSVQSRTRRSRSNSKTPPQSMSITTPRRSKSATVADKRRIQYSPSFDETASPTRTLSRSRNNGPTASTSKAAIHEKPKQKTDKKRKQNQPKKRTGAVFNEIYQLQHSTRLLIPKLPFSRLVREVLVDVSGRSDIRVTPDFLEAIQEACELYLIQFFQDSYLCTIHRGRVTLIPKDMQLAMRLRGINDLGCN